MPEKSCFVERIEKKLLPLFVMFDYLWMNIHLLKNTLKDLSGSVIAGDSRVLTGFPIFVSNDSNK